jgi:uncharacterized protein (TIGR03437 family)
VEIALPAAAAYVPGVRQQWTVTITDADAQRYGFQLSARLAADNRQAGRLDPAPGESNIMVICAEGSPRGPAGCPAAAPIEYIEHSASRQGNTFRVEWTPPATDQGPVRIYLAANAANGNGESSGDDIYTASSTLIPQAAAGPTFTPAGIVSAASFTPAMAPGSLISIFGQNLAPATRTWENAIVGTNLPSELEGVRVTIGGKLGFLHFVSPTQINVLLSTDEMSGTVDVRVTTPQGAASAGAVVSRYAPALFLRPEENRRYVAASDGNGAVVAKLGLVAGVVSRPALPGEEIALWASGLGPTAETVPSGQVLTKAYPLANLADLKVTVGGREARVTFAGSRSRGCIKRTSWFPRICRTGTTQSRQRSVGCGRRTTRSSLSHARPAP